MAFVAEDGTGRNDANAYTDDGYADAYFSDRGITAWIGDVNVKQQALIRATDFIDTVYRGRFRGQKQFPLVQALEFPRTPWPGTVPVLLKKATCEYALRALTGELLPDPETDPSGARLVRRRERVGPLEDEWEWSETGALEIIKRYPAADLLLKDLLNGAGKGYAIRN